MANKTYFLDRDGATPQVVPANTDEKLKVYDSYEDIDTTKLVDGEVVSTKEGAADGNNVYDYVDKQIDNQIAEAKDSILDIAQSYSTEDQLTGGFWIDGMPIHRKVISTTRSGSGSFTFPTTISDVDKIINLRLLTNGNNNRNQEAGYGYWYSARANMVNNTATIYVTLVSGNYDLNGTQYCIVEYTKTTD